MNCPKCQAPMEEGYLLDRMHGDQKPAEWIEGQPERSIVYALRDPDLRRPADVLSATAAVYDAIISPAVFAVLESNALNMLR